MQFLSLLLATLAFIPAIMAAPIETRQTNDPTSTAGGATGPGTIITSPNGVECTGDSNGVTLGDIVGNLVGCAGVGGLLGGK